MIESKRTDDKACEKQQMKDKQDEGTMIKDRRGSGDSPTTPDPPEPSVIEDLTI